MDERRIKQYKRLRNGYPRLFTDGRQIAKLILKAFKDDMEPLKVSRYLETLKQIQSRRKGYKPVPDMVIDLLLDVKLTRDQERAGAKEYYKRVKSVERLKECISLILESEMQSKLAPADKGDIVDLETENEKANVVATDVSDMVNRTYGGMGGFPGADTPEGVKSRFTHFYLSDVDDDPEPDAGILYTDWKGSKKASAIVTDGGQEAKEKMREMMRKFFSQSGSWIEVSDAPAKILIDKMNMPTVDDEEKVRKVLSRITDLRWHGKHPNPDIKYGNGWYTRNIYGHDATKIIVGNPPRI